MNTVLVEVQTPDGWVEKTPENGDVVRRTYKNTGHQSIMTYQNTSSMDGELIPITIVSVDGATNTNEGFSKITVKEGSPLVVSFTVMTPDRVFLMPIMKENVATGALTTLYKEVSVVNGAGSVELSLPAGKYSITQDLMNAELPEPTFSLEPTEIYSTL